MAHDATNHLLRSLGPKDAALLDGRLEVVDLPRRHVLERPQVPISHAYFPDAGVGSVVALTTRGRRIEAGLFGREGMSGLSVVMGSDRSPHETFMQVEGAGRRVSVADLEGAMGRSATLRGHLLRFCQVMMVQTAHTALANGQANIEERLARWLLMCRDRSDGDELELTHEFLALMLGVRRAGVTVAMGLLDRRGLVRAHRGGCAVLDREGLEELADGIYGVPEAEYRRLLG